MGKIIRFPIYVDTTKSSETSYGLLNTLRPEVRDVSVAAVDSTVSEKGLLKSVSGMSFETSGVNHGEGSEIFISAGLVTNSVFGGKTNVLQYRTIDLSGTGFDIAKSGGIIYLTSDQSVSQDDIDMDYFNGGILQNATNIQVSDFTSVNSKTLFRLPVSRTVLGKIMLLNNTPFDFADGAVTGDIVYSIGTDGNPSGIVGNISWDGTDTLMDFTYGSRLSDKLEYVEFSAFTDYTYTSGASGITGEVTGSVATFNTNNLVSYEDIKIFRTVPAGVASHTEGDMDIVMFYDNPDTPVSESHTRNTVFMPGGKVDTSVDDWDPLTDSSDSVLGCVQKYNIDNGTCMVDFNLSMPERNCRYAAVQNSDRMYYMGGQVSEYKSAMFKLNPFNNTVSVVASSLAHRAKGGGISTNSNGYVFCGGDNSVLSSKVVKLAFATEVSTETIENLQTGYDRCVFSKWCASDFAYIFSGRSDETTLKNPTVYKFNLTTDASDGSSNNIYQAYSINSGSDNSIAYLMGGHTDSSTSYSIIRKFPYSTEVSVLLPVTLPFDNASSACSTNASHTEIYMMGGNDNGAGGITDDVVKFSMTNHSIQIINNINIGATDFKGGRL